jgi:hypothetical protein
MILRTAANLLRIIPRRPLVRHLLVSALVATALNVIPGSAFAASEFARSEYWLINGPDYRQVTKAVFEEYRSGHSCMRIETKSYPASGKSAAVTQAHCYL